MLCDEKRALGARNKNTENMLLAFIKIDEIVIPLSEITSNRSHLHIKSTQIFLPRSKTDTYKALQIS